MDHSISDLLLPDPFDAKSAEGGLTRPPQAFSSSATVANSSAVSDGESKGRPKGSGGASPLASANEGNGAFALGADGAGNSAPAGLAMGGDPLGSVLSKSMNESSGMSLSSDRWAYLRSSEKPQDVLLRTALQQLSTGKLDDALTSAEQLRNADPNSARAYEIMGAIYSARGNFDKAIPYYDLAIQFDPENPSLYLQRGTILVRQKWTGRAVDDLSRVIKLQPRNLAAYLWRSLAYLNTSKFQLAAADASAVILQNDKVPDAYFLRCVARLQLGRREIAKDDYWAAVKLGIDAGARSTIKPFFEQPEPAKP